MTTSVSLATFANYNPATGEMISEHAIASPERVRDAVLRAKAAQPAWAATPISRRVEIIRRFQSLLAERKQEVAKVITTEAGKPLVEALLTEVVVVLDAARFCAENVYKVLREEDVPHGNPTFATKRGRLIPEAIGVVGIIAPWNYPFSIPATETLAALITGNAVVLKPSELTPNSALTLARLLHEAGVPREVFQVVLGEGPAGAALIAAPIDKIVFTGSVPTGKKVAAAAAERLIPCLLELGGKDAMIVLDDADIDVASSAAVWGALVNAGQTCISVERCFVHRSIHERFVAECARKIASLKIGNGADASTDVGPLISQRQLNIVASQIEEARQRGAQVVCGGHALPEVGSNFYAPTLVTDIDPCAKLMCEETFGPVLPVVPFSTDDEAVVLANNSEFGLAASVWSGSRHRAEAVARLVQAGAVMINDLVTQFAISEAPHGGVKASGIGRAHGLFGMREMMQVKYVDRELLPRVKRLWWFGYGRNFAQHMDGFVDMLFAPRWSSRIRGALASTGALWRKRL